uniref:Uncharacterized protein n=1 Tax=Oryza sativa subsp. japonica TaxID=39947 RepID=Q6ZKH9_ORYSJ|nr:hypothetical protein [Oryza sativa Japonica Group]
MGKAAGLEKLAEHAPPVRKDALFPPPNAAGERRASSERGKAADGERGAAPLRGRSRPPASRGCSRRLSLLRQIRATKRLPFLAPATRGCRREAFGV